MKKLIFFCMFLFSSLSFAEDLLCVVKVNLSVVGEVEISVAPSSAHTHYMEVEGFRFYITNKGHSKFELEIYNPNDPSRGYAEGFLRTAEDQLTWTLWSRDILLESSCRLK